MSFCIALNLQFLSYQGRSKKQERENCCWEMITDHPGVLGVECINSFHAPLNRWGLLVLKIWCPTQRDPLANWALWVEVERTIVIQTLFAFYHHFFGPKLSPNVVTKNYFSFSSRKPQIPWRSFSSLSFLFFAGRHVPSGLYHFWVKATSSEMNVYTVTSLGFVVDWLHFLPSKFSLQLFTSFIILTKISSCPWAPGSSFLKAPLLLKC